MWGRFDCARVLTHFTSSPLSVACVFSRPCLDLALLRSAGRACWDMLAGVLLYDWVVALISCLVIRRVDIPSLLETTLSKPPPSPSPP